MGDGAIGRNEEAMGASGDEPGACINADRGVRDGPSLFQRRFIVKALRQQVVKVSTANAKQGKITSRAVYEARPRTYYCLTIFHILPPYSNQHEYQGASESFIDNLHLSEFQVKQKVAETSIISALHNEGLSWTIACGLCNNLTKDPGYVHTNCGGPSEDPRMLIGVSSQ
ncbi:hypothetical protein N7535_004861 [Penicillium sp. DV-2018c]|nr:hypothetical protein N7461_008444 [Penicillium sp. DV-2018c]KAJ5571201.1 hypothetical protein N7535_004861 [Penicillium sp. DV-2018c]